MGVVVAQKMKGKWTQMDNIRRIERRNKVEIKIRKIAKLKMCKNEMQDAIEME